MKEIAALFFKKIRSLLQNKELGQLQKVDALYRLQHEFFLQLSKQDNLYFNTFFSRVAYFSHKYEINKRTQWMVHESKRIHGKICLRQEHIEPHHFPFCLTAISQVLSQIAQIPIPDDLKVSFKLEKYVDSPIPKREKYEPLLRMVIIEFDFEKKILLCQQEEFPGVNIDVHYDIQGHNEIFTSALEEWLKFKADNPIIHLLETDIDKDGIHYPRGIIVQPDYLMDISVIAGCYNGRSIFPEGYLLNKFLPFDTSIPLMIGNVANLFLDELLQNPQATFKDTFRKSFQLNPLSFTVFSDKEIMEMAQTSQRHFITIKEMVLRTFAKRDIIVENCFIEPSFFSQIYGIQGRLDLFHVHPDRPNESAIVELKSGSNFMANRDGISPSHYVQTLLYDLLIRSVFDNEINPFNYILYSKMETDQLKPAPTNKTLQFEALALRNQLIAYEQQLKGLDQQDFCEINLLDRLIPSDEHKGFIQRDFKRVSDVIQNMSPLMRSYFLSFTAFIAREHELSKTGSETIEKLNGQASLWLASEEEKEASFELLRHLQLEENKANEADPLIHFTRTEMTNPLANFRKGDIIVLYPTQAKDATVLTNQIFKGNIWQIDQETVVLRLRNPQHNNRVFDENQYWNVEHDMLDRGFSLQYQSLFRFARKSLSMTGSAAHRPSCGELILTLKGPREPEAKKPVQALDHQMMTEQQNDIFKQVIHSQDYFLIWGPPGTGKTSLMLKNLVAHYHQNTEETILLLAYTNRAVDEICEAIESIGEGYSDHYMRIGSRLSTDPRFTHALFDVKTTAFTEGKKRQRQAMVEIMQKHRIYVSTISSIVGKLDLFKFIPFKRVIVDEASQVLEPMLLGLLTFFEHFTLIGDHNQLPAVVVQDKDLSKVGDPQLVELGLHNTNTSLFERLFLRCQENKWDWAYAQLSFQGRMHQEIMQFPSQYFYDQKLAILPGNEKQKNPPILPEGLAAKKLFTQRVLYVPTETDKENNNLKTHVGESRIIAKLVKEYQTLGKAMEHAPSIGVITPYRAQIAQINEALYNEGITSDVTVDTVERYQGGARDIILISLCLNAASQLETLVSLSLDGKVDRKLNVALTRSRQHLVLLGHEGLMEQQSIFKAWKKAATRLEIDEI